MDTYLSHHGILGQKWGVRRYQNPDGSLTEAGRRHYKYVKKDVERYASAHDEDIQNIKTLTVKSNDLATKYFELQEKYIASVKGNTDFYDKVIQYAKKDDQIYDDSYIDAINALAPTRVKSALRKYYEADDQRRFAVSEYIDGLTKDYYATKIKDIPIKENFYMSSGEKTVSRLLHQKINERAGKIDFYTINSDDMTTASMASLYDLSDEIKQYVRNSKK